MEVAESVQGVAFVARPELTAVGLASELNGRGDMAAVAAFTCARRRRMSARWVPRLTSDIEAWLSALVSPGGRSEIGTAATRLLRGSAWCRPR